MSRRFRFPVVVLAAGASLAWHAPRESFGEVVGQEPAPTLTGTWVLNREQTEPPRDRTLGDPEGTGGKAAVGMGSRGGGGARDNPTSGGGRGGGVQLTTAQRMLIRTMLQPADSLLITQTDTSLAIDNGTGMFLTLALNGRTKDEPQPDGSVNKSKATRRGTDVVVERDMGAVGGTREVYRVDKNNPRLLTLEFRYEHKRQRRTFEQKRVYELR
ncbi:MAG TPA: hypothetical protein VLE53_04185 [Gemmatimonadaceae bacterium]|nr:hypothetical protein [Gemmatimonadaceae bacterium]